jgi:hypothetical protein
MLTNTEKNRYDRHLKLSEIWIEEEALL